jgi:hypothetical protein
MRKCQIFVSNLDDIIKSIRLSPPITGVYFVHFVQTTNTKEDMNTNAKTYAVNPFVHTTEEAIEV